MLDRHPGLRKVSVCVERLEDLANLFPIYPAITPQPSEKFVTMPDSLELKLVGEQMDPEIVRDKDSETFTAER